MFELSQFYAYCKDKGIDIIPYDGCPAPGATLRYNELYAIFLNFTKIQSTRLLRGICCHELGHAATGALHKVDSPFETVERSEYRASRWAAEHFLTADAFREAVSAGCTELWQFAEYFDLPEADVEKAFIYWVERRGEQILPI